MFTGTYACIVACTNGILRQLQLLFSRCCLPCLLMQNLLSLVTWNFPSRLGWLANEPQALAPLHFTSAGNRSTHNHIEH